MSTIYKKIIEICYLHFHRIGSLCTSSALSCFLLADFFAHGNISINSCDNSKGERRESFFWVVVNTILASSVGVNGQLSCWSMIDQTNRHWYLQYRTRGNWFRSVAENIVLLKIFWNLKHHCINCLCFVVAVSALYNTQLAV